MTSLLGISYIWMQLVYNEHPNLGYVEGNWVVAKSVFRFYYCEWFSPGLFYSTVL